MRHGLHTILKKRMTWLGVGLLTIGLALQVFLVLEIIRGSRELRDFTRVPIPGAVTMHLEAHTEYTVNYESRSVVDGSVYTAPSNPPSLQIDILRNGNVTAKLVPAQITSTYETGSYNGTALGTFQPNTSGEHRIRITGANPALQRSAKIRCRSVGSCC